MHSEGTPPGGGQGQGGYGERAETYLRLLAEAALRPAANGDTSRVRRAADVLVDAGVLADQTAAQILADLQLALRARGRREVSAPGTRMRRLAGFRPRQVPGPPGIQQPWRVLTAGQPTPPSRLMALILMADRAIASATLFFSPALGLPEPPPLAVLGGTDDLGTQYRIGFDGSWAGSTWTGAIILHPAPPAAARWLKIFGPNGGLLRADLTADPPGVTGPGAAVRPVPESPGERLLTRHAETMLAALAFGDLAGPGQGEPGLALASPGPGEAGPAELAATLEAAGALPPLSTAPARLAALGQLLGLPAEGPAEEVPARWTDVIAHYGRRRRLAPMTGTAAIGAALPEVEGARFAVAGLRSASSGTFLHVVAAGLRTMPRRRPAGQTWDIGFSWWARDDAGGWHLGAAADVSPAGGAEGLLRLALLPPLHHATATLTVEVTGTASQVTASLPVRW